MKTQYLRPAFLILSAGLIGFLCQGTTLTVHAAGVEPLIATAKAAPAAQDELLKPEDKAFMKQAEDGDLQERDLGRTVAAKTQNSDVRAFAKMVSADHTKDLQNVVHLMTQKGIRNANNMVSVNHEGETELNGLSGTAMDRAFIDMMLRNHQKDIARYTAEASNGIDPAVRQYAADAIQTLQKHLKRAQELQRQLPQK